MSTRPDGFRRNILPSTAWRWTAVALLASSAAAVGPRLLATAYGPGEPILLTGVTATWEDRRRRAIILTVESRTYTTTCASVLVSRWLLTGNGMIWTEATALDGPLRELGEMPPRRVVSIEPLQGPGSNLRIDIPAWALETDPPEKILGVRSEASVSDDKPCANGFSGRWSLYEALLPTEPGPG